ncbi:MAG: hypothetical protein Q8R02_18070 [Hyphomonadaceae bacterium]|nr:hypothetical protein [Hyphomonadaceae bacterium]
MPDGSLTTSGIAADLQQSADSGGNGGFSRFIAYLGTRSGLLKIWIATGAAVLVGTLVVHSFGPIEGLLSSAAAKAAFVGATSLIALPFMLLFLDSSDNFQHGPRRTLPLLSLGLLAVLAAVVALDKQFAGGGLLGNDRQADNWLQVVARFAFFAYFATAFLPIIWNAVNFARFDAEKRKRVAKTAAPSADSEPVQDDDAEAMGALIATGVVILIGVLAAIAGGMGSTVAFENFYGLVLCGGVIGIFVIVVFLDWISETALVRALSRTLRAVAKSMHFLAVFYDWVDAGLVRIGSSVAGMGQETTLLRYATLAGSLLCLTVLAWNLPPPLGLVPAFLGFLLAISVSRLWSWVEEDRSLATMTDYNHNAPYRIGFREDYREEALLGFVFVFSLLPIAMMQAHEGQFFGPGMFVVPDDTGFFGWFGFFGVELAKAVPIVDWAEIYEINPAKDLIQFKSAAAKHSVFLARVMVDMVLIASLLQVIGIATRNRQQKRLFKRGHIHRLDDFVERTELTKAVSLTLRRYLQPIQVDLKGTDAVKYFDLTKLGRDGIVNFRGYDHDRLFYLYSTTSNLERRAFIAAIAHQGSFQLLNAIDLTRKIAETDQDEPAMYAAFQRALLEHEQRLKLIDEGDIYTILSHLRQTNGLRDFKNLLITKLVQLGSPEEALEKLSGLGVGPKCDDRLYTRNAIADAVVELAPRVGQVALLELVFAEWNKPHPKNQRPGDAEYRRALKALKESIDRLKPPEPSP